MNELMRAIEIGLNYAVTYGAVAMLVVVFAMDDIKEHKAKKAKALDERLAKRKDEFDTKMMFKKRAFEEFRSYIEALPDDVDVKELEEQVAIKELKPVSLAYEDGVHQLVMSSHHLYRPYEVNDFDIRDTLREFTVGDVLGTFY